MKRKKWLSLLAVGLLFCLSLPAFAEGGIPGDGEYHFTGNEFSDSDDLRGVFVTGLPEAGTAALMLGDRVIRAGDALSVEDLSALRLRPSANRDAEAVITFLPVCSGGAEPESVLTMHIEKAEDKPPVAKDLKLETYRNLPNTGVLKAENDDDGPMTFTLKNRPDRGTVELSEDGSFTYTPKRNKVGEDSFTFTATDAAGNESEPAVVRIRILLPQDKETFADLSRDGQFAALWLRESGLYEGERISGRLCFGPSKPVTRGEFLAMVMDLNGIAPEIGLASSGFDDEQEAPLWLRPYLASAMRRGIACGTASEAGLLFRPNDPITGSEAALILTRALGLETEQPVSSLETSENESVPAWAAESVAALRNAGIPVSGTQVPLTRAETADLLYLASKLQ